MLIAGASATTPLRVAAAENSDVLLGTASRPWTPIEPALTGNAVSVAVATILSPLATLAAGVKMKVFEPAVKLVAVNVSKPRKVWPSCPSASALKNSTRSGYPELAGSDG